MDILGLLKEQLTSTAVEKISGFLGESSETTQSAIGSAMPSILGGLMQKASTTQGAGDLLNMIKNDGHDGSIFDNLGGMLGGGDTSSSMLSAGGSLLSSIFGDKVSGLTSLISKVSGLGSGSTSSLLSMAAPMIMGLIGKQVGSQGMGVSGLASMLMGQKDAVKAALPAGIGSILNLDSLGDFVGDTKSAAHTAKTHVNTAVEEIKDEASGGIGKLLPWVLIGALVLGGLYYFKSCRGEGDKIASVADSTANMVDNTTAAVSGFVKKQLSTGVELNFGEASIENELIGFIEDTAKVVDKTTWFNFRDLKFETGSANIDSTSMQEVKNISEIMKAYPNVELKIGGYTDNVGKEASNVKLSGSRASNVMNALVTSGINNARMAAEGYGSQFPLASNDTDEGKAQNRRIAVRVTKK